jgi:translin
MDSYTQLAELIRQDFETRSQARDKALLQTRQLTRLASLTIRAIHRSENEAAHALLAEAGQMVTVLKQDLAGFPDLYYAGYTQDAIKEFAEASITCALIENRPLPMPAELGLESAAYMNGLAEVTGELRRRCLDILRQGYSDEAERLLAAMDEIYAILVTLDYPDQVTSGLRRHTDLVRGIVERTRADLTLSLREQRLQQAIQRLVERMPEEPNADDPGV